MSEGLWQRAPVAGASGGPGRPGAASAALPATPVAATPVARSAVEADIPQVLALINAYADRNLLLRRSEESLRARLGDFSVIEREGRVVACGALSELGPALGEVRSLAVRPDQAGRGLGHALVEHLLAQARGRGFTRVLALTRRVTFFTALGFALTDRRLFEDKLRTDCQACPLNVCCDETALVRAVEGVAEA